MTDQAVAELAGRIGVRDGCVAIGASQAGYYRRHRVSPALERPAPIPHRERPQPRALSAQEQQAILDVVHSDRFVDMSRPRCGPRCSTKVSTSARSRPTIGCCAKRARCVSAAPKPPIPRR